MKNEKNEKVHFWLNFPRIGYPLNEKVLELDKQFFVQFVPLYKFRPSIHPCPSLGRLFTNDVQIQQCYRIKILIAPLPYYNTFPRIVFGSILRAENSLWLSEAATLGDLGKKHRRNLICDFAVTSLCSLWAYYHHNNDLKLITIVIIKIVWMWEVLKLPRLFRLLGPSPYTASIGIAARGQLAVWNYSR